MSSDAADDIPDSDSVLLELEHAGECDLMTVKFSAFPSVACGGACLVLQTNSRGLAECWANISMQSHWWVQFHQFLGSDLTMSIPSDPSSSNAHAFLTWLTTKPRTLNNNNPFYLPSLETRIYDFSRIRVSSRQQERISQILAPKFTPTRLICIGSGSAKFNNSQ